MPENPNPENQSSVQSRFERIADQIKINDVTEFYRSNATPAGKTIVCLVGVNAAALTIMAVFNAQIFYALVLVVATVILGLVLAIINVSQNEKDPP